MSPQKHRDHNPFWNRSALRLTVRIVFFTFFLNLVTSVGVHSLIAENNANQTSRNILEGLRIEKLEFNAPPLHTEKLDTNNEPVLLLAPDDSLPFVTIEIIFLGGSNAESKEHPELLKAMTSLLQLGGSSKYPGEQFAEKLSSIGARLDITPGYENWSISITVLKSHFSHAMDLVSSLLLEPALPEDRLEVIKDSFRTEIIQRNDDPAKLGRRKLGEIMFAGFSPGRTLQKKDIETLNRELIHQELNRRLSDRQLLITVSGDYEGLEIKQALRDLIGSFPPNKEDLLSTEKLDYQFIKDQQEDFRNKIVLVSFPEAKQAAILLGSYLPPHNHEDFFALQTGNYILGGGSFNSRLMREIRTLRGLAYYAYSGNFFYESFGQFFAASGTRVDQADLTLKLMIEMITDMEKGVTEEELELAKDAVINSLVFQFDDPEKYASSEARFLMHHMPEDYLEIFPKKIRSITSSDIARVSRKYLSQDRLFIVVVGPPFLKEKLQAIRPVTVIEPEEILFPAGGSK